MTGVRPALVTCVPNISSGYCVAGKRMKLLNLRPMLRTEDVRATVRFYTEVLGFQVTGHMEEDGELAWASLELDGVGVMAAVPNHHEPFLGPVFSGSLYINVDDVGAMWERVQNKAKICYPLEAFDEGMREFAIYDNNGYLLQFGQPK